MATSSETLEKLQGYASRVRSQTAHDTSSLAGKSSYEESLDDCLSSLRQKYGVEAAKLEKVRGCRLRAGVAC